MSLDSHDWTTVVIRRRAGGKETEERARWIQEQETSPKRRIQPECIQTLIKRRMALGLTQERADQFCSFPKHTFKEIESHLSLPTPAQQTMILRQLGVALLILPI